MTRRRSDGPPPGPSLFLLVLWAAGTAAIAVATAAAWRAVPGGAAGVAARALWALYAVAQSLALYYLLGFVLKSLDYLVTPLARATGGTAPGPPGRAPGIVVLYLTAGDFDAVALDSLLRMTSDGPRRLIVHDDGDDLEARRRIEAFVAAHPARAGWEAHVWHRERRTGGKAGAVNWVLARLDPCWEWMLLCDSDSIALDADVLRRAGDGLGDPGVAVVQFRNRAYVEAGEPAFQQRLASAIDVFDAFATPQARWGYLPFFGHNALVRTASLRALDGLTPGFFSDDLDFSVRLTLAGQRIAYRRDLAFAERHPSDWLAFRKRARKWAFGCMQVIRARARAVLTARDLPLAHRLGLLEFMGFYPAQALLVVGLCARHIVLPWLAPMPADPRAAWAGAGVAAALLLPTFAWAVRERRLRAWPALAWSCVLVYGGSILATARGVWDGFSSRGRPWIPTNLAVERPAVPRVAWGECLLGLLLILVPWWKGDGLVDSPATYLFAATLFLAPLAAAAYRERVASPAAWALGAKVAGAAALVLATVAFAGAGLAPVPARAADSGPDPGPRLTVVGDRLELDGRPFRVRGVHYSPWLPGTGPGGAAPYPGPNVVDADLDRIHALGANTILADGAPGWVAEHARARGLVTFYSFNIGWNDTTAAAFDAQADRIVAAVDSLRHDSGIVVWMLGHEVPDWVVRDVGAARVSARLRGLAARVKALDPGRPIGHGNWPPTKDLDLSFLDLACFNLYPAWPYEVAVRGYGPYLRDVLAPLAHGRPLLVSEFGINSLEAGETRQADVIASCWHEIETSHTAGGIVFEWCDEWWKNYDNPIAGADYWKRQYDPTDAARHDPDPEEYYGIVRADRSAKPALAAVRRMWRSERPGPSWVPWGVVAALAAASLLLLRGGRRSESPRTGAGSRAALVWIAALAGLALAHGVARAATWSYVDTLDSPAPSDSQFGWTVADGGDLDGDGRNEVAIGAHFANVGGFTAAGQVLIFRDGWGSGTPPWQTLSGIGSDEHFGEAIAGGRDVDGDGRTDLAVGAPLRSSGGSSANGGVDVYRGGALTGAPWARLEGEASDDWFGQSVALGDFDGDGKADIAVGAPYNDRGGSAAGAVFIFRGGASAPSTPWKVLVGAASNDQFGWSIACVGDVNGDGYDDLVVGARLHGLALKAAAGRVYLFHGGANMDTVAAGGWDGEAKDDWFGNSVSAVGDVDGGGRPDILAGAPYNDRGGSAAGAEYLFRGEDAPGSAPLVVYTGESPNAQLGWAVGGAGDVDGDGRPDVLGGARQQATANGLASGRVYLYAGGANPSATPEATSDGEAANDWLGNSLAGAAQFVAVGQSDAVAGAPYADTPVLSAGRAYAYALGTLTGVGAPAPARAGALLAAPNPSRDVIRIVAGAADPGVAAAPGAARRVTIEDVRGRVVRVLALATAGPSGGAAGAAAVWDLRDAAGRAVPAGLYFAHVVPSATGGSAQASSAIKLIVTR